MRAHSGVKAPRTDPGRVHRAYRGLPAPHHLAPRGLAAAPRGLAAAPRGLAVAPRGLAVAPRGLAAAPRRARWLRDERGQSSVELVALLPLALLVGFAILTLLAAQAAAGQAASAAQAGAMALLQDGEPEAAARAALPPGMRKRATIRVRGRAITVTVEPATKVGFLRDALAASSTADAGPVAP